VYLVGVRIAVRNARLSREVETTRERILGELEEARQIAKKARNGSAMAMASLGKAKVCGLIIDRREVGEAGAFDNLTDEELVREAAKMARKLGFTGPHLVEDGSKKSRHDDAKS
jgi:hypothetical protein